MRRWDSKLMRIALLCHAFPPEDIYGIPLYVSFLARALAARNHDVTVLAGTTHWARRDEHDGYVVEWLMRQDGPPRMPAWGAVKSSRRYAKRLAELHRIKPFDVIEAPNYVTPAFWSLLTGIGKPAPAFVMRASSPRAMLSPPRNGRGLRLYERLERYCANASDGVIAHSTQNLAICKETYKLPDRKLNQVILLALPPGPAPTVVPHLFNDGQVHVLYVGRMEERKGFDILAQAWPKVVQIAPEARLTVAGEDYPCAHGPSFFKWAVQGMPDSARARLFYKGFVKEPVREDLYRACHFLVAPSRYESFGLMALEAMRYGRPVVSSNVGGIPDVVQHGVTGLLTPPENVDALTETLVSMVRDPARRQAMAVAAVNDLNTRFTETRLADETADFYARAIHVKRG